MKRFNYPQIIGLCLLGAFFAFGIYACKKNRFKKENFLSDLYTQKIDPEIASAVSAVDGAIQAWDTYSSDVSESNKTAFYGAFNAFHQEMEKLTFYNLGDVGATYIFSRMYKTKIDTTLIQEGYNAQATFVEADIPPYVNTQKGLYAMEYLLFSNRFKDSLDDTKFLSFMGAHLAYIKSTLTEFQTSWSIYEKNFISSTEGGVSDSYNMVVNRIIHVLEDLSIKRIGKLVETDDATIGVGYYSSTSFRNIQVQVDQLHKVYNGIGVAEFNSVYNNVRKKNKKLADQINEQFDVVIAQSNAMNEELTYYVNEDQATLDLYTGKLNELLKLFKVDVQDELDIILTFGDTDGD